MGGSAPVRADQPATAGPVVVIKSQYRRLSFDADIRRLAVGDSEILSAELINSREILTVGRQTGRTTVIVWLADGTSREFVCAVQRDLSVLERALRTLHPSIVVESAPDRDALILSGIVPDVNVSMTAETVARNYLGSLSASGAAQPLIAVPSAPAGATPEPSRMQGPGTVPAPTSSVINLLRLESLPASREEKVQAAVREVGGERVVVRRVVRGAMPDDSIDTLVLEGDVANQTALTRVLVLAAQLFAGQTISASDIRVVADEGGGLAGQNESQSQSQQTQLGGGSSSSLFGGARGSRLSNQVRTNLARASAIELAGGRVLSFIKVKDLPQVRVAIRLLEINRTKLRAFGIDSAAVTSDFRQPSLNPARSATTVQGDQAARVGAAGAAIQNVLSFLSGGLANELQYSGGGLAIDTALSLLERAGVAQTLSSPSLTVLSGEMAQVQIGGEVPVPVAFAPAFGNTTAAAGAGGAAAGASSGGAAATPGVFSSVDFVPFGVQLQVRPLVGDDDTITLDVQPMVVTPDAVLTDAIRQSSGTAVATTAFQTRALRTSSRLQDGEALVIAGLVSQNTSSNTASTPVLRRVPILGRLFESFNRNDQDTELVVVVNPVLLRTRAANVAQWSFVDRQELLRAVIQALPPKTPE
jgi:Flp pilus assembly secretin CpaC